MTIRLAVFLAFVPLAALSGCHPVDGSRDGGDGGRDAGDVDGGGTDAGGSAPMNTTLPVITGTTQQGDALSTTSGAWSNAPTSYGYQWRSCSGSTCSNISGATSSSYTLTASEVGRTLSVDVTATNAYGSGSATSAAVGPVTSPPPPSDLTSPVKKQIFLELLGSAENSSLNWESNYGYCQNINDGRGYTTGFSGFTTDSAGASLNDGAGVLGVLKEYDALAGTNNLMHKYEAVLPTANTATIDAVANFCADWATTAADARFQRAEMWDFDTTQFDAAVALAKADGVGATGQALFNDDANLNGYGGTPSLENDEACARAAATPPSQGGNEIAFLDAFLDCYAQSINADPGHAADGSIGRVTTMYKPIVDSGNLDLHTPLTWSMYGQSFSIPSDPAPDPALSVDP